MFKKGQSKITISQEQIDSDADNVHCPECKTRLWLRFDSQLDSDSDLHIRCRHCGAQIGVKAEELSKAPPKQKKMAKK